MKKLTAFLTVLTAIMVSLLPFSPVHASGSSMFFSPASQTVNNGASFNVQLRANVSHSDSGDDDGITAVIAFPKARLQVTGMSSAGSSFPVAAQQNYNNTSGTINVFQSWDDEEPEGNLLITTITFRAVSTGSAGVSFTFAEVGNDDASTSSGNYTIVTPPSPPPPPPPAPPSSPSTPSASPSSSSAPSTSSSSSSSVPSSSPVILPNNAANPSNTEGPTSPPGSTPTEEADPFAALTALPVSLRVVDGKNKPVSKAKIVISKKTYTTSSNGMVSLFLTPKVYSAVISSGEITKTVSFTVKAAPANTAVKAQSFTFSLTESNFSGAWLLAGGLGLLGLIITGIFLLVRRRHRKVPWAIAADQPAPPPIEGAFFSSPEPTSPAKTSKEPAREEEMIVPVPAPLTAEIPKEIPEIPTPIESPPVAAEPFIEPVAPEVPTEAPVEEAPAPPMLEEIPKATPPPQPAPIIASDPLLQEPASQPEVTQPKPKPPHKQYNSVYLDEEEPKDMFELAEEQFHYRSRPK